MVMEREVLERWLAEGLSIADIGRRLERHPSTVSYWLRRYGLRAADRGRNTPRGSLSRDLLTALVADDLSVREIAARVERSASTVRYWLRRYGLATSPAARGRRRGEPELRKCIHHGQAPFVGPPQRRVCARCRAEAVTRWRQRAKRRLVAEAGGACATCGYDRCVAALQFHHLDPAAKRFGLASRGLARSIESLREEASRCVLLCANCHAEVEAGVRILQGGRIPPSRSTSRQPTTGGTTLTRSVIRG